jgi:hypothetical protein
MVIEDHSAVTLPRLPCGVPLVVLAGQTRLPTDQGETLLEGGTEMCEAAWQI